jgi:hypothetical protein
MKRTFLLVLAAALVLGWASLAGADIKETTLTLSVPDADLAGCPGPYATVAVALNDDADTASFVFTRVGTKFFGGTDAIALNVGGTFNAPTVSNVLVSTGIVPTLTLQANLPNPVSVFGDFNIIYNTPGFGTGLGDPPSTPGRFISATINLTGVSADTLAELLLPNFAAAHVRCPAVADVSPAYTGSASVPLPGAVLLLGAGLVRLAAYARRRQD